ncbi:hypothetical protein N665_1588s0015 [Sinapis alba]|nr:hypothetical protein N665_1588s0015 [Sinapis alba]
MVSGAGDAFSHRRWPLSPFSSPAFNSRLVFLFKVQMLRIRSFPQTKERDTRRNLYRRHEFWLLVFTGIIPTSPPVCSVCSPAMSREDSLATVVLRFTGLSPVELHSSGQRKGFSVDRFCALQLLRELRSQRPSPHSPSPGSETAIILWFAPFHNFGVKVQDISPPNPNIVGIPPPSSPLSEPPSPIACPSLNGGSAYLRLTSHSPACSGELAHPPMSTIYLSGKVYCTISSPQFGATTSRSLPAFDLGSTRPITKWAWPISFVEDHSLITKKPRPAKLICSIYTGMVSLIMVKLFEGFFGSCKLRILQYYVVWKNFSVDSPTLVWTSSSSSFEEKVSQLCLPSMNGDALSDSLLSPCFNLLTGLLPCVAVCTGPEGAIENTLVSLVGEGCPSTSLVTISQLSDYVVNTFSTHSNFVLNSLSSHYEDLSCFILCSIVVYGLFARGCLIPSCPCSS